MLDKCLEFIVHFLKAMVKLNKKGMIKLGTLSDKLNHTAECKESIREAVNQNLGDGAELISSSTQFDQYSNIINSI